ncbi:hypothetical protein D5018_00440 [Parashewanella curva]|uniref:Uncharacterized protein n=1 Tax=Parashewanella curva TaxID=2338552 RepID=A0A3L8Q1V6_9GAMM|nr:hypothetical protein [Parashewanella curva]RLV61621.1 hypothetical protein D5018_00440 [Parashewanella curva]
MASSISQVYEEPQGKDYQNYVLLVSGPSANKIGKVSFSEWKAFVNENTPYLTVSFQNTTKQYRLTLTPHIEILCLAAENLRVTASFFTYSDNTTDEIARKLSTDLTDTLSSEISLRELIIKHNHPALVSEYDLPKSPCFLTKWDKRNIAARTALCSPAICALICFITCCDSDNN